MDNQSETILFEIKVNEAAKKFIRKAYPAVSVAFWVNILLALTFICVSVYRISTFSPPGTNDTAEFYFFIAPTYFIIHTLIAITAAYFYFVYIKRIKKDVLNSDENVYNAPFGPLYLDAVLFAIIMISSFLFTLFEVYVLFIVSGCSHGAIDNCLPILDHRSC